MHTTVDAGQPAAGSRPLRFPWVLFLAAWLLLFGLQQDLAQPASADSGSIDSLIGAARSGSAVHQLLTLALGIIGAVLLWRNRGRLAANRRLAVLFFAYVGWLLLSVLWAEDLQLTLRRQLAFVLLTLFAAGCAARMTGDMLARFLAGLAALNLAIGMVAEIRYGHTEFLRAAGRFSGAMDPNTQAAGLAVGAILICWLAFRARGLRRMGLLGAAMVLFLAVFLTESRTALLSALAALAGSVAAARVLTPGKGLRAAAAGLLAAAVATAGIFALVNTPGASAAAPQAVLNALRTERDTGEVSELTGRVFVWEECLKLAAERPLLGVGFGGFWSPQRDAAISDELGWPVAHAHSAYLDQWLALGLPGFVLYLLLVLGCLATALAGVRRGHAAYGAWAAVCLFVLVHGAAESVTVLPSLPQLAFQMALASMAFVSAPGAPAQRQDV